MTVISTLSPTPEIVFTIYHKMFLYRFLLLVSSRVSLRSRAVKNSWKAAITICLKQRKVHTIERLLKVRCHVYYFFQTSFNKLLTSVSTVNLALTYSGFGSYLTTV